MTVWSIDGSSLTGTELDGRESVSVFSLRRGDKTVMGKKYFLLYIKEEKKKL